MAKRVAYTPQSRTIAEIPDIQNGKLVRKLVKHDILLPCPFCGSSNIEAGVESSSSYHVRCYGCGARTKPMNLPSYWDCDKYGDVEDHLIKKAVKAWNKRVKKS